MVFPGIKLGFKDTIKTAKAAIISPIPNNLTIILQYQY